MLKQIDPEVAAAILKETKRQAGKLELIPSENFVDEAVLEAQGCIMTNKYAEGYPGKRYYHGCEFVDVVEALAIERAKKLFGADHANVQAHSGTQANMAVYFAVLQPGDTILGMNLAHGGHLSHGSPANFSGRFYKVVHYGVDQKTERIDFNEVEEQAKKHKPKVIVVGASAYSRDIPFEPFRQIADKVGAVVLADIAHVAGLVAAGIHSNPVPLCEFVTTTTHKTLRGPRGGMNLCKSDFAKALDSRVFPGMQGGPLMHIIAAKAVALKEALTDEFRQYQVQIQKNARTLAETLTAEGFRLVSGGTDNHLMLIDVTSIGVTGAGGRRCPGQGGDHGQQEHDPLRHAGAHGDERHPRRHPGHHVPRDEGGGDEARGPVHLDGPQGPQERKHDRQGPQRGKRALRALPAVCGSHREGLKKQWPVTGDQ